MSNAAFLRETEQYFHEQIPLTRAMGVQVEAYDQAQLILTAPLEPNHNHLGTAFGGSLSAIATLAGYGMLWLQLGDRRAHVVVRESVIHYRRPVRGTIRAICQRPDAAVLSEFTARFSSTGRARIKLQVTIEDENQVCVDFEGVYVAIR